MLEQKDNNPMDGHPWDVKVKLELPFHLIIKPLHTSISTQQLRSHKN